ncbi:MULTISPECIES: hypothetical protein [Enterobacter]|jgi:hypothetical protein|uniref:Uncharacterized protein n=1 Tax=Enterobacter bugandensis TaxID=881260 RepID=A0ABX4VHE1_9ENTR|nr:MULTISPECIES: hypothetical protein [Enterobacter]MBZ6367321.1 hypothetical protein [Enterobacter bugandensis]MCK6759689.1 hypothetical protein [Enterobacter bugandensis]MCK6830775.1 hypothetical protein [Enterobacter bugandensis]MCK7328721.1 hypothetical protein [Enterobacter bugandensis]MCK7387393.1 hypothetical protein [Enterobacter bugandensis]
MVQSIKQTPEKIRVCVRTNSFLLEKGLAELARYYFIARDKMLCIIDADTFGTKTHLVKYLEFIRRIKPDMLVLITGHLPRSEQHAWYVKANESLAGWRDTIDAMNFMLPNLDNIIDHYKRRKAGEIKFLYQDEYDGKDGRRE